MGHFSTEADLCSSSLRQLRETPIVDVMQNFSPATIWNRQPKQPDVIYSEEYKMQASSLQRMGNADCDARFY